MTETIARWLCRHMHRKITTPVNGVYHCLSCLRTFEAWVPDKLTAPDKITFEVKELEALYRKERP